MNYGRAVDSNHREQAEADRILSHYRPFEKISPAGMGIVYRAVNTELDREVAVTVLSLG